ncbi:unnamed protein product [Vitrella brassicaformis CCMP3155]|uniref:PAS domain-containing protein n=1 Tax=Vitrella brassicaformis (strain CCMP3155) TaxID=1169540 RepID=A0A0G4F5C8_VITBC|nr:unnamed protein product [Vitrella brassicaformis CCMP3155]|eukprot:CEM07537.1 unnamed protein product [Vitrella brassicaformis CCMP3155]
MTYPSWDIEQAIEHFPAICGMKLSLTVADPTLPDCPLIGCSSGFTKLTGFDEYKVIGQNCRFLNEGCHVDEVVRRELRKAIHSRGSLFCLVQNKKANGSRFTNMLYLSSFHIPSRAQTFMIGVQSDATKVDLVGNENLRLFTEEKICELFNTVDLTNWVLMKARSFEAIERMKKTSPALPLRWRPPQPADDDEGRRPPPTPRWLAEEHIWPLFPAALSLDDPQPQAVTATDQDEQEHARDRGLSSGSTASSNTQSHTQPHDHRGEGGRLPSSPGTCTTYATAGNGERDDDTPPANGVLHPKDEEAAVGTPEMDGVVQQMAQIRLPPTD